jgi:hypothetical protein
MNMLVLDLYKVEIKLNELPMIGNNDAVGLVSVETTGFSVQC